MPGSKGSPVMLINLQRLSPEDVWAVLKRLQHLAGVHFIVGVKVKGPR